MRKRRGKEISQRQFLVEKREGGLPFGGGKGKEPLLERGKRAEPFSRKKREL